MVVTSVAWMAATDGAIVVWGRWIHWPLWTWLRWRRAVTAAITACTNSDLCANAFLDAVKMLNIKCTVLFKLWQILQYENITRCVFVGDVLFVSCLCQDHAARNVLWRIANADAVTKLEKTRIECLNRVFVISVPNFMSNEDRSDQVPAMSFYTFMYKGLLEREAKRILWWWWHTHWLGTPLDFHDTATSIF